MTDDDQKLSSSFAYVFWRVDSDLSISELQALLGINNTSFEELRASVPTPSG